MSGKEAWGAKTFTYDAAGNITSDTRSGSGSAYTYTYNNANRLTTVSLSGNLKATYTYNGGAQLIIRVITNSGALNGTTHYVHDLMGNVIAEADSSGNTLREYLWLPETEIAPPRHADHLNRPVRMKDASTASVWEAAWLPWGAAHSITGTASLDARFPGQWYQLEAGLHYNWHRHILTCAPPARRSNPGPPHPARPARLHRWTERVWVCTG
jgi:YD repeat-containing protein